MGFRAAAIIIICLIANSCAEKEFFSPRNFPFVKATGASIQPDGSIALVGEIDNIGDNAILDHGFFISENKLRPVNLEGIELFSLGTRQGDGEFSINIKASVTPDDNHYLRAFAQTSSRTIISEVFEFIPSTSGKVKIFDFEPKSGDPGTQVKIIGEFFSITRERNFVKFGDISAEVQNSYIDTLIVISPILSPGSYPIEVTVGINSDISSSTFNSSGFTPSNVKLHLDFNDNLQDMSGRFISVISGGTTAFVEDRHGNLRSSISFDSPDDYLYTFGDPFDFEIRTVSVWVYPEEVNASSAQVALTRDNNQMSWGLFRIDFANGAMNLYAGGSNFISVPASNNTWYHVVMIRTSNKNLYYVNNVSQNSGTPNTVSSATGNQNLIIGNGRNFNQPFVGRIDDLIIYNKMLTEAEVNFLYNN